MGKLIDDIEAAGPVRGLELLFERTRTGIVSLAEFTSCVQHVVFRTLEAVDALEDDELLCEQLAEIPTASLAIC